MRQDIGSVLVTMLAGQAPIEAKHFDHDGLLAAEHRQAPLRVLIEMGVREITHLRRNAAVGLAIANHHNDVLREMAQQGWRLGYEDGIAWEVAAVSDNTEAMDLLSELNITLRNVGHVSDMAAFHGGDGAIRWLMKNAGLETARLQAMLIFAVTGGRPETADLLVSLGAQPPCPTTEIMRGVLSNHADTVVRMCAWFLKHGADAAELSRYFVPELMARGEFEKKTGKDIDLEAAKELVEVHGLSVLTPGGESLEKVLLRPSAHQMPVVEYILERAASRGELFRSHLDLLERHGSDQVKLFASTFQSDAKPDPEPAADAVSAQ